VCVPWARRRHFRCFPDVPESVSFLGICNLLFRYRAWCNAEKPIMKPMSTTTKQVVAVIISILIVGVAIYGSYFPMRKAEIFIATLQGLQSQPISSLNELETR